MTPDPLHELLLNREGTTYCVRVGCTTCGSESFRAAWVSAVSGRGGAEGGARPCSAEVALATLDALASFVPPEGETREWTEPATRFLLCECRDALGADAFDEAAGVLEGTWAGELLERMRTHDERLRAERKARREYESPEAAAERREAKRLDRQARHEERVEHHRERGRRWLEERGEL